MRCLLLPEKPRFAAVLLFVFLRLSYTEKSPANGTLRTGSLASFAAVKSMKSEARCVTSLLRIGGRFHRWMVFVL